MEISFFQIIQMVILFAVYKFIDKNIDWINNVFNTVYYDIFCKNDVKNSNCKKKKTDSSKCVNFYEFKKSNDHPSDNDLIKKYVKRAMDSYCRKLSNASNDKFTQKSPSFLISDIGYTMYIRFKQNLTISYTIVGGGGAGGIGFAIKHYYIYGGGGAAGDGVTGIRNVCENEIWKIIIGKGGDSKCGTNGKPTILENNGSKYCDKLKISVNGGKNGSPSSDVIHIVTSMGDEELCEYFESYNANKLVCGGENSLDDILNEQTKSGNSGGVGTISVTSSPGDGGYTSLTGFHGKSGCTNNLIGCDGKFGSGGGGSSSVNFSSDSTKYSANGGNGYLLINIIGAFDDIDKQQCNSRKYFSIYKKSPNNSIPVKINKIENINNTNKSESNKINLDPQQYVKQNHCPCDKNKENDCDDIIEFINQIDDYEFPQKKIDCCLGHEKEKKNKTCDYSDSTNSYYNGYDSSKEF
jgi:hypothetical protein